jgi:hypothetical protein
VGSQLSAASAQKATVAPNTTIKRCALLQHAPAQPLAFNLLLQSTSFFRRPVKKYIPYTGIDVFGEFSVGLLNSIACCVITQYFSYRRNPPPGERFQPDIGTAYALVYEPVKSDIDSNARPILHELDNFRKPHTLSVRIGWIDRNASVGGAIAFIRHGTGVGGSESLLILRDNRNCLSVAGCGRGPQLLPGVREILSRLLRIYLTISC